MMNVAGLVVKRENRTVIMMETVNVFHRGSRHWVASRFMASEWEKLKDRGNVELKPMLDIPLREADS